MTTITVTGQGSTGPTVRGVTTAVASKEVPAVPTTGGMALLQLPRTRTAASVIALTSATVPSADLRLSGFLHTICLNCRI